MLYKLVEGLAWIKKTTAGVHTASSEQRADGHTPDTASMLPMEREETALPSPTLG